MSDPLTGRDESLVQRAEQWAEHFDDGSWGKGGSAADDGLRHGSLLVSQLLAALSEATLKVQEREARIGPIDPGGGDRVDELESAIGFLRYRAEAAEQRLLRLQQALEQEDLARVDSQWSLDAERATASESQPLRPHEQAKRGRCGAARPGSEFGRCGRWKGHDGQHREMCAADGWPQELPQAVDAVDPSASNTGNPSTRVKELENELARLQQAQEGLVQEMRQMTALARMHSPHVVGCRHIDKWANALAQQDVADDLARLQTKDGS